MRKLLLLLVRGYQWGLRPLMGPSCRFYPSCSCYAHEAIARHGAGRGVRLALRRLTKCHPWNAGGYDPVPVVDIGRDPQPETRTPRLN